MGAEQRMTGALACENFPQARAPVIISRCLEQQKRGLESPAPSKPI